MGPGGFDVPAGSFGYFIFDGLRTGETYIVTVTQRRFTFQVPSRVVNLTDNIADLDSNTRCLPDHSTTELAFTTEQKGSRWGTTARQNAPIRALRSLKRRR